MTRVINFFQWLIFVIIIPLFALTIIAGSVLYFSGVDVIGKTKDIAELLNGQERIEKMQAIVDETKDLLKEKVSNEQDLQKTIEDKNKEIKSLKEQLTVYEEHQKANEDIINSYENMSPKKAAEILAELERDQAIDILKGLKPETLAKVFENMETSVAADLTKGITE
ncbi:hypothetical protein LCL98_13875 [Rossellomorea aquimaris]|nr:hypothetical protein [Rossellomorea aquimaris]